MHQQQQQQQQQQQGTFLAPVNIPNAQAMDTNPTAPNMSPFSTEVYASQNYDQIQRQQQQKEFALHQQRLQQQQQQQQHPSNSSIFTVSTYDNVATNHGMMPQTNNPFDTASRSMSTNQQTIRVETVPLDLSKVASEEDKRTITCVHRNMINLMEDVPLFNEKVIEDMGHAYKVTFKWIDEFWTYDNKVLNEKILSINGVQTIHSGHKQITVIVSKNGGITLTNGQNNASSPIFPVLDLEDPVARVLYVPRTSLDADFVRFITKSHPSMPCMQKGLMLNFMKKLQKDAQISRKKATKREMGVHKRRQ